MSHYLVTGGLGVIGSQFTIDRIENGHAVEIIDCGGELRNTYIATQLAKYKDKIKIHVQRLETTVFSNIGKFDYILHAAASTGIPHSEKDPNDDWVSNVDATRHILEELRRTDSKIPMVVLSSVKPYRTTFTQVVEGETRYISNSSLKTGFQGFDENTPLEPDEPYAASKMAQSALCMAYAKSYKLPITTFRCSNLYGPAPCHGPRHGWLTWFCISAVLGWPIKLQGNGKQCRDMLYATDVNSAVLAAFNHIELTAGEVFNVGGGPNKVISCLEAVKALNLKYELVDGRKNEDLIFIANSTKFQVTTGWAPAVQPQVGIDKIVSWAEKHIEKLRDIYAAFKPC
jgi:CDP-paratose 2-epimerase